ncbi:peptide ABC transporter substrate-binding protein [Vibrio sp.]|nr:peptide ABC transporter substrate-binding protein [Vibrio sp.]
MKKSSRLKNTTSKKRCSKGIISASIVASLFTSLSYAAQIPEGVELAKEQYLVRNNDADVATLDPPRAEGLPEMHVLRDLFEGLVIQDSDGNVIPGVATSWETSDNQTFTFQLREDAKWSDGTLITANDFVYSIKRAVNPEFGAENGWYYKMTQIKNMKNILAGEAAVDSLGVTAKGKHTIVFTLEQPVPYFVPMLAHSSFMPVPKHAIEEYGEEWLKPENLISNGAFTVEKRIINERIELVKNPNYWDHANTVIDKVTFLSIESQNSSLTRFKSGEIDITSDVPAQMAKALKSESEYTVTPLLCTEYYAFNTQRKPFDDARVRKAISYSVLRDVITNGVTQVGNLPAYTFTHKHVAGFKASAPEYSQWTQEQRNKKAKDLLNDAGYGKDNPLKFDLVYPSSDKNKSVAVAIASMLKKNLGIDVVLENQEWKAYLATRKAGEFDVLRASWCGDYNEPSTFLSLMTSGNSGNRAFFKNTTYDELIDQSLTAPSANARNKIYDQAEQVLATEMPLAPIYFHMQARMVRDNVGGFPVNNVEGRIYSKDLYIKAL